MFQQVRHSPNTSKPGPASVASSLNPATSVSVIFYLMESFFLLTPPVLHSSPLPPPESSNASICRGRTNAALSAQIHDLPGPSPESLGSLWFMSSQRLLKATGMSFIVSGAFGPQPVHGAVQLLPSLASS